MIDQRREQRFLEDINRYLPKNVDWKQGAIDYLHALMEKEGSTTSFII